ncbi:MAG: chromosomal replication initiator protein DnaA [Clostridia bacterium]|nr:chromosomal replication initiator protein DnaA [Clostridia bacterium]MBQ6143807.1 chromosomal replication initiator protein DnaA [Clostridia bacterium]
MNSFNEAWSLICDFCKTNITDVAYKTWISRIEPVKLDFDEGKAVLMVPNEFHRQTLNRCYKNLLTNAFEQIFGSGIDICFSIPDEIEKAGKKSDQNLAIDSDYEFTFDTYIVGSSNKFAHAAALAVAANPAGAYNPLFIYGNSGLGKTHLLYAICNDIKKSNPDKTFLYIKGDDFTNELIDSIRKNTTSEFHQKYRQTDVLLVDDIQFIAGKDSTQEEFFHTFNSLYEAKKQIVLTSDRPPKEIQTLEDRLRTRFEWGLIADIQPPDFETRIAIVKRKAELLDIKIPNEVCEYISKKLKNNIRQLEGAVKKMKAHHLLGGEPMGIQTAQLAISDILNNDQPPPVTIEKIIEEVARTFGVSPEDIRSSKRSSSISNARQISMYVVREITQLPLVSIGEEFGGRDHSTIVYALQQVEKIISKDQKTKAMIEDIIKNIRDR